MYEEFFGLQQSPFMMTPDPHFLFLTPAHREALAGLIYVIVKRKGITLLTGEAGTGKTTLLRTVLESIPGGLAHFGLLIHPTLNAAEFLEMILLELGVEEVPESKARRLIELERILVKAHGEGRVVVLVIDEAHKLSAEVLEEVRLLTNFENAGAKLLQIVLAAQTELDAMLARQELRQLKQRIAYRFTIQPLSAPDVAEYVGYRWLQAGGAQPHAFGEDALDYLALFSGGIPRVVNAICDNALLLAYSEGVPEVRAEHIVKVAKDLAWEADQASARWSAPEPEPELSRAAAAVPGRVDLPEAPGLLPTLERYGAKRSRLRRWTGKATPAG